MKKLNNSNKAEICLLLIIFGLTLAGFLLKKMFEIKSSMSVSLNLGTHILKPLLEKSINDSLQSISSKIPVGSIIDEKIEDINISTSGFINLSINYTKPVVTLGFDTNCSSISINDILNGLVEDIFTDIKTNNIIGDTFTSIRTTVRSISLVDDINTKTDNISLVEQEERLKKELEKELDNAEEEIEKELDNAEEELAERLEDIEIELGLKDIKIEDIHPIIKNERGKCFVSLDTDEIYNLIQEIMSDKSDKPDKPNKPNKPNKPDTINKITKIKEKVDLGIKILKTIMIMLITLSALLFVIVIASHYVNRRNGLFKTLLTINRFFVKFVLMLFGLVLFLLGISLLVIVNIKKYNNKIQDPIDDYVSMLNDTINNVINLKDKLGLSAETENIVNIVNIDHITYEKMVPKVGWILGLIGFVMFVICLFL
jgi:hypothetical protein